MRSDGATRPSATKPRLAHHHHPASDSRTIQEIAQIQELNMRFRVRHANDVGAQVRHEQRQDRLEAIQQELAQLAALGSRVRSVAEMKERHRSRLRLLKEAS
jgi:hypothetical protein